MNTTHAKSVSHSFSVSSVGVSNSFLTCFMTIQLKRKNRMHNTGKKDKAINNKFLHKHKQINSECKYAEGLLRHRTTYSYCECSPSSHLTMKIFFLDCKLTLLSILRFLFQSTALTGLGLHGQKAQAYIHEHNYMTFSPVQIFLYWFSRTGEVNHGTHAQSGLPGHGLLMLVEILPGPTRNISYLQRAYEIYTQHHISAGFMHLVVLCTREVLQGSAALCSNRPAKIQNWLYPNQSDWTDLGCICTAYSTYHPGFLQCRLLHIMKNSMYTKARTSVIH